MNTISRLLGLAALAAGCGIFLAARLAAAQPAIPQDVPVQDGGAARQAGKVLILPSERCMEGEIERLGEQYRIRRGSSEVWLPTEKALRLCADWDDAFSFMKRRANLGDPDERLRLARWCQLHALRPQALAEAKAALAMRPSHAESRQLVNMLTRDVASAPAAPAKVPPAAPTKSVTQAPLVDVSAESFALFATKVQPILMNACANCHAGGRGGDFQLTRTDGSQRTATQANLAAVLDQVNKEKAVVSPLLVKAISPHGGATASPLKDRQSVPYRTMQGWVDHLLANNPHLTYLAAAGAFTKGPVEQVAFAQSQAKPPVTSPPPSVKPSTAEPRVAPPLTPPAPLPPLENATPLPKEPAPTSPVTVVPMTIQPATNVPVVAPPAPTAQVNPADAYDAVPFNLKYHSRR